MHNQSHCRRSFIKRSLALAMAAPLAAAMPEAMFAAVSEQSSSKPSSSRGAKVSIVACRGYGEEVRPAFDKAFDLLGGIGSLIKGKTVTVKLNLTGTNFGDFMGRPVGETYMTHPATVMALTSSLFAAGARRVRFVESTNSRAPLESSLSLANWDVPALSALGKVEFENTRNLGSSKNYSHLNVPDGGYMFSSFDLNRAYEDADVIVSLAKLKNHATAGVTLTMKNMFGTTPNALYGADAGQEDATEGRFPLHFPGNDTHQKLPGLKPDIALRDPTARIPRIVADVCSARPVHLCIIDGITTISGGEGPWCEGVKFQSPGLLIAGLNPVSTDAVGTAVMGYPNPRASRGTKPFHFCDNHLLLAEQAGVGTADLGKIEVLGLSIDKTKVSFG